LLLQTWYNLAEFKKHIIILVLLLVKIWLENMMCKNFTQSAPMPSRCGVLLIINVHDDLWLNGKLKQVDCGMLLFHMDQTAGSFHQSGVDMCSLFFLIKTLICHQLPSPPNPNSSSLSPRPAAADGRRRA
jgi:hypothetical protein